MKKSLLLLLLVIPRARSEAQGVHGKILFVRHSPVGSSRLSAGLRACYSGTVDSMYYVPNNLGDYDAVVLSVGERTYKDTLASEEALSIVGYLKQGGKLLYRSSQFGIGYLYPPRFDTLSIYLGVQHESYVGMVVTFDTVVGVDSEFANELRFVDPTNNPLREDNQETYSLDGSILPVLLGSEYGGGYYDQIGWIPEDRSIHAVLFHPINFPVNYTSGFVRKVLCDYFGLCTDAVNATSTPNSTTQLSLYPNPATSSIHCVVSGLRDSPASVQVCDMLGRSVMLVSVRDASDFSLNTHALPNGMYSIVVSGSGRVTTGQFVVAR